MILKIQITFKNHLVSLFWLLFYLFIIIVVVIYFKDIYGNDGLFILWIGFLIQLLPTIYIHLKFYYLNRFDTCFIYDNKLEIVNSNNKNIFLVENISNIEIYKSRNKDSIPFFTWETYYCVKIILNNGDKLILTSLLDNKIEEKIKLIKEIPISVKEGLSYFFIR